jgi:hypothetical protein
MPKPRTNFFAFAPEIVESDASGLPKRFEGVAYSGGVIPDYGWYGDTAIDLSSMKLPDGAIFALVDHDPGKRAGKLTAMRDGNQIKIAGEFFTASESGREVAALFAEGAPWQLSVGIHAKAKRSDEKSTVNVNGQALSVHTLFTDSALREVSFVPVGADPATSAVAFSMHPENPGEPEDDQMTIEELTAKVAELEGSLASEKARADAAEGTLREITAAARKDSIKALAADLGRDFTEVEATTFIAMDDATFTTLSATLRSVKPAAPAASAPSHLFSEQATGGAAAPTDQERVHKARAKLINQVSGKAA